ncbi:MAG: hemerythrin domain-containing protein [Deltaproteobacteria bacterium]|nr:MAG: hemerythrin domain-containing protein [Deltaproteobacteria bacterium]TMQ20166.1 MAG: hemerythrin domain-containing protein [Deltaproteobacteria bacterium]
MTDPVQELVHDHADINRRVLALGAAIRALDRNDGHGMAVALAGQLDELRDLVFLHFAREEEGLFPFVAEAVPELADQVHAMALAHDAICGGLARMYHLASTNAELAVILTVFARFETTYGSHAETEAELLHQLSRRLGPAQRARLADLVRGL